MGKRTNGKKADIAYQNKDVASKVVGEVLEGKSLAAFGLPSINFVKYLNYAARVIKRYARKKQLDRLKTLKIIVIYTADVEKAREVYDLGGVTVRVETAFLVGQDTEEIYRRLDEKVRSGQRLSDEEQLQLMILPLTVKGKEGKQELIVKAVELAKQIKDRREETEVLAGILTFADKVIDEEYRLKIREEIEMTQIVKMIFDDGVKAGNEIGFVQGEENMLVDLVCRKLRKGKSAEEIAEALEEELNVIQGICQAAAVCGPPYNCRKVLKEWKKN